MPEIHDNGAIGTDPIGVSIGVLTWQSRAMLKGLLDSIQAAPPRQSIEVVVVDNGSTDGTAEMIGTEYPRVRLVRNELNKGVAPARNQILQHARGTYVLMLDVDTLVLPGAIDELAAAMDAHPDAAVAGPLLRYEDGRLQLSCRPFPGLLNVAVEGTFLREWFPNSRLVQDYTMEKWDHAALREVDWLYGACLMIRRQSVARIGVFDESFFYLYEDVDFCFRAKKAGLKVLYVPQASVVHFLRRERKGLFHPRIGTHLRSITRYLLKDRYGLVR
jgi:GT2 family glycosyltransferase